MIEKINEVVSGEGGDANPRICSKSLVSQRDSEQNAESEEIDEPIGAPVIPLALQAAVVPTDGNLSHLIDHTILKPEATKDEIAQICHEARKHGFASVCVNPSYVTLCADLLKGSKVQVCTVVGFPLGATSSEAKAFETQKAIGEGATEVDMVINLGALKSGDYKFVEGDIARIASVCHRAGATLKVIIEAALLTDEEKVDACRLAKAAQADFVKTSTGFGPGGATPQDVALMRQAVGNKMGVKASGGIKTRADAERLIEAGADRLGASASVKIVQEDSS